MSPVVRSVAVARRDRNGNRISLGSVLPESKALLFTGPPGMGKSTELDRAEELAGQHGWTTIRMSASADIPIEHHLTGAVRNSLETLEQRFRQRPPDTGVGRFLARIRPNPLRKLRKTVNDLTRSGRKTRVGVQTKVGTAPVQLIHKTEQDTTAYDKLGTTLNDFADELGKLTEIDNKPIVLLVDNIDKAEERDRAGLNELAIHIEALDRPVWLIAAGGSMSTSSLMTASRRMSGIATTESNQFDIRELEPIPDKELRRAITDPLETAGIPYDDLAIQNLLAAANGHPGRFRNFCDAAIAYRDPEQGITFVTAARAIAYVNADAAQMYQDVWDQKDTNAAQKDLLARVAAEGSNGLSMPAITQAAGPGAWQQIDEARQDLVARGLLREYDGTVVAIPDHGFRDWLNDYLGQTPKPPAEQPLLPLSARSGALAPTHPTGKLQRTNEVFGSAAKLVHQVDRKDERGRPVSLDQRVPRGTSVLFTGPPGSGTSQELNRTKKLADAEGWISIRLDATRREPIEARVIRALQSQMATLEARFPPGEVRQLKKLVNGMAIRTQNRMHTAEARFGVPNLLQVGVQRSWEGVASDSVGATLNDVTKQLGRMAAPTGMPILLMVDNLDAASKSDLATLSDVSSHLRREKKPLFLIAAGGEEATSRLLEASGGKAGKETREAAHWDVRRLTPLSAEELRPALTRPMQEAGIRYTPEAVDRVLTAANGNPSRLRTLTGEALDLAGRDQTLTAETVGTAIDRHEIRSRVLYDAAWYNCTPEQKDLLARTAAHGSQGMPIPTRTGTTGPERWSLDGASQKLVSRGLLTRTGQQIKVGDPGFQKWVQTRIGVAAAQSGVVQAAQVKAAVPTGKLTATGERAPEARAAGQNRDLQANR